jgi:hypothetical protein
MEIAEELKQDTDRPLRQEFSFYKKGLDDTLQEYSDNPYSLTCKFEKC